MKILFIGGVFADENEQEVCAQAKGPVEYSANIFQKKMIAAFKAKCGENVEVISAPFVGAFPNNSKSILFSGFHNKQSLCQYVTFINIWGARNFSRAWALKKAVKNFIDLDDKDKLIVVYSAHTPFFEAAAYAKEKDPRVRICAVIPDLPQYMNLNNKVSTLYKVGKKFDIKALNRYNRSVDTYMLLTDAMKEKLDIGQKQYIVVEGILDDATLCKQDVGRGKDDPIKYIVYTGKLQERFGVKNLVDAFGQIQSPYYRLVLCGKGDLDAYVQDKAKQDRRIMQMGQVTPAVASEWIHKADVLVNPRMNNEIYTRYSFPSKNLEYLACGVPVVAYFLDGMKPIYRKLLCSPADNSISALKDKIVECAEMETYSSGFAEYAKELTSRSVIKKLIELNFGCEYC